MFSTIHILQLISSRYLLEQGVSFFFIYIHRITDSQNGRGGRDLCGSSSPTPLQ